MGRNFDKQGKKYVSYGCTTGYYVSNVIYEKKVYVIGPCIVRGWATKTKESLVARLQEKVEEEGYTIIGCVTTRQKDDIYKELLNFPVREQDIMLFIEDENYSVSKEDKTVNCLDVLELYNQKGRPTWYENKGPIHLNAAGINALSDLIYQRYLKQEIEEKKALPESEKWKYLQKGQILSEEQKDMICSYIDKIKINNLSEEAQIGAIVMNCNPFTSGHQYLAEYAASRVDWLYLFVVQEDKSVFPFQKRFDMVKEGVRHLANVHVVPSGEFVLSVKTMQVYFEKEERQDMTIDASADLEIFSRYIAPALHIKRRFVGEEPYDHVTRQYNEQMKMILGEYSIEVEEIPRKKYKNEAISASRVRKLLTEGKLDECKELVPESTWKVLQTLMNDGRDGVDKI